MKIILINIFLILLISCKPMSLLPKEVKSQLPKGANTVLMNFDMSKDSLFLYVSEFLSNENFRMYNLNKEIGFINTDGKKYGSGMLIRLNIQISADDNKSKLLCMAEFSLTDTNEEDKDKWWRGNYSYGGHFTLCFDRMVLLLQKLSYKEVQYISKV